MAWIQKLRVLLLCANLFLIHDSERLSPAARLHLFGPNKKALLYLENILRLILAKDLYCLAKLGLAIKNDLS